MVSAGRKGDLLDVSVSSRSVKFLVLALKSPPTIGTPLDPQWDIFLQVHRQDQRFCYSTHWSSLADYTNIIYFALRDLKIEKCSGGKTF